MPKGKQLPNPFYVALVIVGIAFSITACAYGVMAFKATRPGVADLTIEAPVGLMGFLDEYGGKLMAIELVLLGIATVGAIGSDHYWNRDSQESHPPAGKRQDGVT